MDFVKLLNTLDSIQSKKTLTESADKKEVDEEKTEEGNEFSGELAKAKAAGKKEFEVDGKKYQVKESDDSEDEAHEADDEDDKETVEESQLEEKAAPGQEDWIKSNKARFIKQYGKEKGLEVLYATAWKRSKKNESMAQLEECYDQAMMGGQPEQESGMNINASTDTRTGSKSLTVTAQGQAAEQLAQLLKLSGLGAGKPAEPEMAMGEEYANEPDPQVQGVEVQMQQGNDLNRPKNSYPKVSGGDNPMAMREARELALLEQQLSEALAEFKVSKDVAEAGVRQLPTQGADYSKHSTAELKMMLRPGILHRDEARFKALIRKELQKREQQGQQGVAEAKKGSKPDFLDMDKDGNKKEPMKKALKDKGSKSVKEGKKPDFLDMEKMATKKSQ